MIIDESQYIGICTVYYGAITDTADKNFTNTERRRFAYVFAGEGVVRHDDLLLSTPAPAGTLLDLRNATASSNMTVQFLSGFGMWAGFYVTNPSDQLDATLLTSGFYDLTKTQDMETLLVLKGEIIADGKTISIKQFAHLPDDRPVHVVVPEGSIAIHFSK